MRVIQASYLPGLEAGVAITVDGHKAIIELTKKSLLDLGVAILSDLNEEDIWAKSITYRLPPDEADGRGPLNIQGGTNDPVIVCLARRHWLASNRPNFQTGPVPVPTLEEARVELADPTSWKMGF